MKRVTRIIQTQNTYKLIVTKYVLYKEKYFYKEWQNYMLTRRGWMKPKNGETAAMATVIAKDLSLS